jgi:hypothetical protein
VLTLAQDGEPGESRLIDLEDQSLEQAIVVRDGESVFGIVVGSVVLVATGDFAVGGHVPERSA